MIRRPPRSPLFPSPPLFRSVAVCGLRSSPARRRLRARLDEFPAPPPGRRELPRGGRRARARPAAAQADHLGARRARHQVRAGPGPDRPPEAPIRDRRGGEPRGADPPFRGRRAGSHRDFLLLAALVKDLSGGVYLNVGSAVILPEVFLKCVSLTANLGRPPRGITTVNMDFIQHYRPTQNVLVRPTATGGGRRL